MSRVLAAALKQSHDRGDLQGVCLAQQQLYSLLKGEGEADSTGGAIIADSVPEDIAEISVVKPPSKRETVAVPSNNQHNNNVEARGSEPQAQAPSQAHAPSKAHGPAPTNHNAPLSDIYNLLGVSEMTPPEGIRARFFRQARRLHRALAEGPDYQGRIHLLNQLRYLCIAHDILSDPITRADYDLRTMGLRGEQQDGEAGAGKNVVLGERPTLRIGELLTICGMLESTELDIACDMHKAMPEMQFGSFLVKQGFIEQYQLEAVLFSQKLLRKGLITVAHFQAAMEELESSGVSVAETVVERGYVTAADLQQMADEEAAINQIQQPVYVMPELPSKAPSTPEVGSSRLSQMLSSEPKLDADSSPAVAPEPKPERLSIFQKLLGSDTAAEAGAASNEATAQVLTNDESGTFKYLGKSSGIASDAAAKEPASPSAPAPSETPESQAHEISDVGKRGEPSERADGAASAPDVTPPDSMDSSKEPDAEEAAPEPDTEETEPEEQAGEALEPVTEKSAPEPDREEAQEPVTEETGAEPITEKTAPEPVTEETAPEPITEKAAPEPVTEETEREEKAGEAPKFDRHAVTEESEDWQIDGVEQAHFEPTADVISESEESEDIQEVTGQRTDMKEESITSASSTLHRIAAAASFADSLEILDGASDSGDNPIVTFGEGEAATIEFLDTECEESDGGTTPEATPNRTPSELLSLPDEADSSSTLNRIPAFGTNSGDTLNRFSGGDEFSSDATLNRIPAFDGASAELALNPNASAAGAEVPAADHEEHKSDQSKAASKETLRQIPAFEAMDALQKARDVASTTGDEIPALPAEERLQDSAKPPDLSRPLSPGATLRRLPAIKPPQESGSFEIASNPFGELNRNDTFSPDWEFTTPGVAPNTISLDSDRDKLNLANAVPSWKDQLEWGESDEDEEGSETDEHGDSYDLTHSVHLDAVEAVEAADPDKKPIAASTNDPLSGDDVTEDDADDDSIELALSGWVEDEAVPSSLASSRTESKKKDTGDQDVVEAGSEVKASRAEQEITGPREVTSSSNDKNDALDARSTNSKAKGADDHGRHKRKTRSE
ncbi:MAG TPA: hypothetical protein V6D17_24070 [Candidatus Obscuribacterales bacterium]